MNTKKYINLFKAIGITLVTSCFFMFSGLVKAGDIVGSVHDFSDGTYADTVTTYAWNSNQELCTVCHTPHASDTTVTVAPLWDREVTTSTFTVYSSNTLDAVVGQPSGVSVLCLSCHDGSIALDSFGVNNPSGGASRVSDAGANRDIGESVAGAGFLNNDHPISFAFNTALATADGGLFDPSTQTVTIGSGARQKTGTIDAVMLSGGTVQCTSCHDVHNNFVNNTDTNPKLLRIALTGSALCLTCHDK